MTTERWMVHSRSRRISGLWLAARFIALILSLLLVQGHALAEEVQRPQAAVTPMASAMGAWDIRQDRIVEVEVDVRNEGDVALLQSMGYSCDVGICKLELLAGEELALRRSGISVRTMARAIKVSGETRRSGGSALALGEHYVFNEDYVDHNIPDGNFPSGCGNKVLPSFEVSGAPADATITRVMYSVKIDHDQASDVYAELGWWHSAESSYMTIWNRSNENMDDDLENDADIELRSRETNFYNGRLVNSTWQLAVQDCAWNMITGHIDFWKVYVYYWTCDVATPATPVPANGANNQSLNVDLDWADAAGANSYDVYFGTSNPPPWFAYTSSSNLSLPTLNYNSTYYWQIEARTACGSVARGPVWYFSTPHVPGVPSTSSPKDGDTDQSINVDLSWVWQPPPATSFDVYCGTGPGRPLPLLGNTTYSVYPLGELSCGAHYYWQIVAKNEAGSTSGPEWDFTTACCKPGTPSGPSPATGATNQSINVDLDWTDASGASSYDVYFGTSASPPLYANTSSSSYALPALSGSTHYYWKIVAKNLCEVTAGPVWNFSTQGGASIEKIYLPMVLR